MPDRIALLRSSQPFRTAGANALRRGPRPALLAGVVKGTALAVPYKAQKNAALAAEGNVSEEQISCGRYEMTNKKDTQPKPFLYS